MRFIHCFSVLSILLMVTPLAGAEIYQWVDEHGIRRYSNQPPPEGATVIDRAKEYPHDAEADRQRREKDAAEWAKMQQRLTEERKKAQERRQKEELQEALEKQRVQAKKIEALEKKVEKLRKEQKRSAIIVLPQAPARPASPPWLGGPR
jgi:hypothetical protein